MTANFLPSAVGRFAMLASSLRALILAATEFTDVESRASLARAAREVHDVAERCLRDIADDGARYRAWRRLQELAGALGALERGCELAMRERSLGHDGRT